VPQTVCPFPKQRRLHGVFPTRPRADLCDLEPDQAAQCLVDRGFTNRYDCAFDSSPGGRGLTKVGIGGSLHQHEQLLESHWREVSIVYCDRRDFTSLSETTDPEEVMRVLGWVVDHRILHTIELFYRLKLLDFTRTFCYRCCHLFGLS
jgi:hypothetical protein